jgi:sn-glycerol 3-phosphate transport system substrate-binding protein
MKIKSIQRFLLIASLSVFALSFGSSAIAATQIQWWHAMGGANGERVNKIAEDFNL